MKIDGDICEVLYTQEDLQCVCERLGAEITSAYEGEDLLVVGILNGAVLFFTDLIRQIDLPLHIDFMSVSSYGSKTSSSGNMKFMKDLNSDIAGRNVLIVEDILDTGHTLHCLVDLLSKRNPKSIKICVLLDKPARRIEPIFPDFVGFNVPDAFVVGYGLDYAEAYRNLPYIGILDPKIYTK